MDRAQPTSQQHHCPPELGDGFPFIKDDIYPVQRWLFVGLGAITGIILVMCVVNIVLLHKNRRFKNMALMFFYMFSFITLFCKRINNFTIIVRLGFFLDLLVDWGPCTYQLLKWLPFYTYAVTAYCYITNW